MNSEVLLPIASAAGFVVLSALYVALMSHAAAKPERRSPGVLGGLTLGTAHGAIIALREVALPIFLLAVGSLVGFIMVAVAITPVALRAGVRMRDWLVPYLVSAVLVVESTWPLIDAFRAVLGAQ